MPMTLKEGLEEDGGRLCQRCYRDQLSWRGANRWRTSTPKLAVVVRKQIGRERTFFFFWSKGEKGLNLFYFLFLNVVASCLKHRVMSSLN
ncbi:hypothetical protein PRUPE_2G063100 [Prunus persica]|uniref:Uncharacterized protein n=1 Tax=Prunus persica TaxID=3760 RepID=A0A251QFF4_PRUPE|nr:hypothetical protein PRUPE_2G063100 [Prunus persica]